MSARGKVIDTIHTETEAEESGRDENGKTLKLHVRQIEPEGEEAAAPIEFQSDQ